MAKQQTIFLSRTSEMRVPDLGDLEVGMEFFVVMEGGTQTVYKDTFRGRLNVHLPNRFYSERRQEWTDRVVETPQEYEDDYLKWVKYLVKNKRLLVK